LNAAFCAGSLNSRLASQSPRPIGQKTSSLSSMSCAIVASILFRSHGSKSTRRPPMGEFIFHITAALAELERSIIRERTRAGLTAARARGPTKEAQRSRVACDIENTDREHDTGAGIALLFAADRRFKIDP